MKIVYVGLTIAGGTHATLIDGYVKLLTQKKPPLSLNMRNSTITKHAGDYLFKAISSQDYYLTALNLKFCYLTFDQMVLLSNSLRFNKSLVKLDLSSNALKPCVARFLLDALLDNYTLSDLSLLSNFLDDEFAVDLSHVLEENPVLYRVDIGKNPIGP